LIGQTLSHYRITAAIGAGGMGEVYRANDTKLGRDVALKVLPVEMASSPERLERFRREAKALAALDHPGIVTVYSVEEADGVHFLTMQLVEGKPLDKLVAEGALPVERIVGIGAAIADALTAAHEKGIVHRDLKPANVMVTSDGRVKVLDFGLAKVAGALPGEGGGSELPTDVQTREGVVVGTMPYMSPEQVQGRAVDQRTDIFSLGIMLYEMATGRRPFQGESSADLVSSILRDSPRPVTELRADLPRELARIIRRCLEKSTRDRLQSSRDLHNELKELRGETGSAGVAGAVRRPDTERSSPSSGSHADRAEAPWIAVLPFKTQGSDPELSAFGDGLGEDITTGLSRFPHLHVISRNSAMQYAGRSLDVRAVGRELGARYALEGAVRKAGSAVRVSVQLLDAETGTHLWAESYDRDLAGAGIFKVQDDVTDRVVATVADPYGVLVRSMAVAVRDRPVAELSARELVLRVSAYWHQIRPDEHARLRTALEQRLEREPTHADAWACLSRLYSNEHAFRLNPLPDSVERARKAADRAIEIDPTCQVGWEALAYASYFARDIGAFRDAAQRAIALNPRNTSTVALMGVLISHSGEWERGCEITRGAMALNPHHPGWYQFPFFFDQYRKGEFEQALETTKRLNMPEDFWVHVVTAAAAGRLGRKEEARAALETLRRLLPGYRDELGPTLGLWILDAAVVGQVTDGIAQAEALVGQQPQAAPASGATPA
jgi:serine/threonine protein kinase/tetratricopeptide (TPR) repeat protein